MFTEIRSQLLLASRSNPQSLRSKCLTISCCHPSSSLTNILLSTLFYYHHLQSYNPLKSTESHYIIDIFGKQLLNKELTGAPVNPINGTFPSNLCLIIVIASPTYVKRDTAFSICNLLKSFGSTSGSGKTGPLKIWWQFGSLILCLHIFYLTTPGLISTVIPRACGMTKISEKIIDASRSNRLSGCIVTSQANSGVRQTSKKSCSLRTS